MLAAAITRAPNSLPTFDSGEANAASRAQHQQAFARLHLRPACQCEMRRAINQGEARSGFVSHIPRGIGSNDVCGTTHFFRESTVRHRSQDTIADSTLIDTIADFNDVSRDFRAWTERKGWFELIQALDHQDIGKVDTTSTHTDPDLAGADRRAISFRNGQKVRTAKGATQDCFHGFDMTR